MPRIPEFPHRHRVSDSASTVDPAIDAAAAEWFARCDAGLTPAQEQALQRWLAADPRHEAALARFDAAWSTFGKATRTGQADELLHELANRAARRRRLRVYAAAASVAVLLTVAAVWRLPRQSEPPGLSQGTATILVPVKRTLPDGSTVVLRNGAQIAVAFTAARRHVQLQQGQAMFEVATDQTRPFVVSASGVEVQAVGTAFSIQLGRKEVEILVTEGTVAVAQGATAQTFDLGSAGGSGAAGTAPPKREPRLPNDGTPTATGDGQGESRARPGGKHEGPVSIPDLVLPGVRVSAGSRVVVEIESTAALPPQVLPVAPDVLDEWLAWRHLRVEFSGTPLADAVALLNREAVGRSESRLLIDDPALGSMRVSGIFRVDNTDAFVLLLEAGFGVEAQRAGSTVRLRKAPAVR